MIKRQEINPVEITVSEAVDKNYHQWRLTAIFWFIAILLGIIYVWDARHSMLPDGISYLDIGDAYLRGDWNMAINAYWSPFYSWLLGLAMFFLKPPLYYEFTVVHILNFAIYLCALGCFHFFLLGLLRYHRDWAASAFEDGNVTLPGWTLQTLGYTLFIWSSLCQISVETPDICVSAFVYLTSGILLRIHNRSVNWLTFIILGVVLGLAYLAKAAMFVMAFIFLGCSVFLVGNLRKAIPLVLIALVIFLAIGSPFIIAISNAKGRLTFSDAGKLNYLWAVNNIFFPLHWAGESPGNEILKLKHPPRKLSNMPKVYEFGTPIGGTYPIWYDPSYWNEGIKFNFDLRKQLKALKKNIISIFNTFEMGVIIYGALIFYFMGRRRWFCVKDISKRWSLFIPAISALAMYSIVYLEFRYVSPFIVLLCMGVFSGVRLPKSQESRRLITYATLSMAILIIIPISMQFPRKAYSVVRYLIKGEDASVHIHWQVANALKQIGVQPGDKVACIGDAYGAYWARLARVRIVAEIRISRDMTFWEVNCLVNSKVIETLAGTEAKVIVARIIPQSYTSTSDWKRLENTDYYVYILKK